MRVLMWKFTEGKLILSWVLQHISSGCQDFSWGRRFLGAAHLPSWTFKQFLSKRSRADYRGEEITWRRKHSSAVLSALGLLVVTQSQRTGWFCQVHSALCKTLARSTENIYAKYFKVLSYSSNKGPCWEHEVGGDCLLTSLLFLLGNSSAAGEQLRGTSTRLHKTCWMFNWG